MTHWNTDQVVKTLKEALTNPHIKVSSDGWDSGGVYDTDRVFVEFDEEDGQPLSNDEGSELWLQIIGFTTAVEGIGENRSDAEIEHVELCDNSGTGIQSSDPLVIRTYGEAMIVLKSMGFSVVPTHEDFF